MNADRGSPKKRQPSGPRPAMPRALAGALAGALLGTLIAGLVGCATPPAAPAVGNFAGLAPEHEMTIVNDTVRQLLVLYEPARYRLNLRQPTPDPFGVALIAALRGHGYALSEYAGPAPPAGTVSAAPMTRDQRADAGVDLRYILDRPEPDIVRVTALIGSQSLSRAYTASRGRFLPFGAWARQE